jgi:hypothetical protein
MSAPFSDNDLAYANRLLKIEAELNELIEGLRAHRRAKSSYAESLALIAEFFGKVGHPDVAHYLARHGFALFDRDVGIKDPSLDLKGDRRTQDSTVVMKGRMWVALAYECFRKATMSHPEVAGEIIKHSDLKPLLRGKNASLQTSPKSWHDQFMYKKITNRGVQNAFNLHYRNLCLDTDLPRAECLGIARNCLVMAEGIARSI